MSLDQRIVRSKRKSSDEIFTDGVGREIKDKIIRRIDSVREEQIVEGISRQIIAEECREELRELLEYIKKIGNVGFQSYVFENGQQVLRQKPFTLSWIEKEIGANGEGYFEISVNNEYPAFIFSWGQPWATARGAMENEIKRRSVDGGNFNERTIGAQQAVKNVLDNPTLLVNAIEKATPEVMARLKAALGL